MLGKEARNAESTSTVRELVKGSISLTQRDGVGLALNGGQQIAETPHSALIYRSRREFAIAPDLLQSRRVRLVLFPPRVSDLQKISAVAAAEILAGLVAEISASNAAETEVRLMHIRR
jgi:hypothetical protein